MSFAYIDEVCGSKFERTHTQSMTYDDFIVRLVNM